MPLYIIVYILLKVIIIFLLSIFYFRIEVNFHVRTEEKNVIIYAIQSQYMHIIYRCVNQLKTNKEQC